MSDVTRHIIMLDHAAPCRFYAVPLFAFEARRFVAYYYGMLSYTARFKVPAYADGGKNDGRSATICGAR